MEMHGALCLKHTVRYLAYGIGVILLACFISPPTGVAGGLRGHRDRLVMVGHGTRGLLPWFGGAPLSPRPAAGNYRLASGQGQWEPVR